MPSGKLPRGCWAAVPRVQALILPSFPAAPARAAQIKYTLIKTGWFKDGVPCHIAASLCAGFMAVVVGSPADVLKSRMMGEGPLERCPG